MADIIIPGKKKNILSKDCSDFCPLKDGTLAGDKKYCDLSFQCRQFGMRSEFVKALDPKTGEVIFHDYLCTGQYVIPEEKSDDEEAS